MQLCPKFGCPSLLGLIISHQFHCHSKSMVPTSEALSSDHFRSLGFFGWVPPCSSPVSDDLRQSIRPSAHLPRGDSRQHLCRVSLAGSCCEALRSRAQREREYHGWDMYSQQPTRWCIWYGLVMAPKIWGIHRNCQWIARGYNYAKLHWILPSGNLT